MSRTTDYEYIHGGDIFAGDVTLDLSVNINPLGMPEAVRRAAVQSMEHWEEYPDVLQRRIRARMADFLREEGFAADPEEILFGNGASDLLYSVFHRYRALLEKPSASVLIPAPGFAEYRKAAEAEGWDVSELVVFSEKDAAPVPDSLVLEEIRKFGEAASGSARMVVLCNPNNPDGHVRSLDFVRSVFGICRKYDMILLVDESFLWFCEDGAARSAMNLLESGEDGAAPAGLVVLNAFTKIFAMAGLRLGYLIADRKTVRRMREIRQPWSISAPAEAAGIACMAERDFIRRSAAEIRIRREEMKEKLEETGAVCAEATADFLLFRSELPDLGRKLRGKGILIRDCSNYSGLGEGWYRAAVKDRESTGRLCEAIRKIREAAAERSPVEIFAEEKTVEDGSEEEKSAGEKIAAGKSAAERNAGNQSAGKGETPWRNRS